MVQAYMEDRKSPIFMTGLAVPVSPRKTNKHVPG